MDTRDLMPRTSFLMEYGPIAVSVMLVGGLRHYYVEGIHEAYSILGVMSNIWWTIYRVLSLLEDVLFSVLRCDSMRGLYKMENVSS